MDLTYTNHAPGSRPQWLALCGGNLQPTACPQWHCPRAEPLPLLKSSRTVSTERTRDSQGSEKRVPHDSYADFPTASGVLDLNREGVERARVMGAGATADRVLPLPGQRSLAGYSPWGHKEWDMMERLSLTHSKYEEGFFGGSDSKESARNVGDPRSIPGFGKTPWRRKWWPIPVFLPGEYQGQKSLGSVHGVAKSWTQLSD